MIKVSNKDTDSLFEKSFTKYPFNSEKKKLRCQIGSKKAFRFRYIHIFSKKLMTFQDFITPRIPIQCHMFFKEQEAILQFCFRREFI